MKLLKKMTILLSKSILKTCLKAKQGRVEGVELNDFKVNLYHLIVVLHQDLIHIKK